jgi:hypothetical protein
MGADMNQTRETLAAALANLKASGEFDPTKPIADKLIAEWNRLDRQAKQ